MAIKKYAFTSAELQDILGGYWYPERDAHTPDFTVDYFVMGLGMLGFPNACYIAMTKETWLKGTGNSGHYKDIFSDSHITLAQKYQTLSNKNYISAVIAEHPIIELSGVLPQLIVGNSFKAISILAEAARDKMQDNGTVIAVTGAVGKSTTVSMLQCLLGDESDYITNIKWTNINVAVALRLAAVGIFAPELSSPEDKPNVCTLEIAASALWMRNAICNTVRPHIAIITHIALTQYQQGSRNIRDVAVAKSKVCQGIVHGGKAILYRDMPEYDFISETVSGYGAVPVTYGETPDCDTYVKEYSFILPTAGDEMPTLSAEVKAVVLGEEITYRIGTIGKPVVLNSLAALTAAKIAGFDIGRVSSKLSDFKGNRNVAQLSNCSGVCILDCSHNSEIPSIIAAFDLLKQIKQKPGTRKLVLLSRIVNMHEKAPEFHMNLLEPITSSGIDRFFFHEPLDEYKYLMDAIPPEISGGKHKTAEDVVEAVLNEVHEGDSILVMGCPRGCDFGKVLELLSDGILAASAPRLSPTGVIYSIDQEKRIAELPVAPVTVNEGLGHLLILRLALELLSKGKIKLSDMVKMGETAAQEHRMKNALGVSADEYCSVKTLIDAIVSVNSPDAVIALAHYVFPIAGMRSAEYYRNIFKQSNLLPEVAINLTGRKNKRFSQQAFTVDDLEALSLYLFSLPQDVLHLLECTGVTHKEKILMSNSVLHSAECVLSYYCFGQSGYHAIAHAKVNGENLAVCVCGAKTPYERDAAVSNLIQGRAQDSSDTPDDWIQLDDSNGQNRITIAGDTYFGEWYSRDRKAKNVSDALQKYGYSYSLEKVTPLLPENDYNIVNFEAVLTEPRQSPFDGHYTFLLDAEPRETLAELKRRNVNAIMLANNHSMDFGESAAKRSLELFRESGFRTLGFGKTTAEAERPLCFIGAGRRIILFNAYWYRDKRHYTSRHYAMGSNAGTACVSDGLFANITSYREKYPDAFIVFSPHWGSDFAEPFPSQRKLTCEAIRAGVDCIIGHGSHIISDYERIYGKFVIHSIGNFVFNSNSGDFVKNNKPPYGYVSKLIISKYEIRLRLYPILTHNPTTFWQPCRLHDEQIQDLMTRQSIGEQAVVGKAGEKYLEFVL